MRAAFVRTLVELAEQDSRLVLLTADLGFMALEPFSERFPDRFVNVGVAEQNMIGIATGLAEAGFIPYCYSIAPFAALRPLEFIRNGPVLHGLPVRIVGVGGGFEYGHAGHTHHGIDDVGALRVLPGLDIAAPADAAQAPAVFRAFHSSPRPVYFRIGKNDSRVVTGLGDRFELGRIQFVSRGAGVLVLAMGSVAAEAALAVQDLAQSGQRVSMAVAASIVPLFADELAAQLRDYHTVITVEAHSTVGGLGSLVAEVVAEAVIPCRLVRCGIRERPPTALGSEAYLHRRHGLDRRSLLHVLETAVADGGDRALVQDGLSVHGTTGKAW